MDRQYVGIDFHRRRSVIVRMDGAGERLGCIGSRTIRCEFAAVMARGGRGAGGGDRSDLWLVLGGRSVAGAGRDGASREPVGR